MRLIRPLQLDRLSVFKNIILPSNSGAQFRSRGKRKSSVSPEYKEQASEEQYLKSRRLSDSDDCQKNVDTKVISLETPFQLCIPISWIFSTNLFFDLKLCFFRWWDVNLVSPSLSCHHFWCKVHLQFFSFVIELVIAYVFLVKRSFFHCISLQTDLSSASSPCDAALNSKNLATAAISDASSTSKVIMDKDQQSYKDLKDFGVDLPGNRKLSLFS